MPTTNDKPMPEPASAAVARAKALLERVRVVDPDVNQPHYRISRPFDGSVPAPSQKSSAFRAAFRALDPKAPTER